MKKNRLFKLLFLTIIIFLGIVEVKAYSRMESSNFANAKKGALLCQYVDGSENVQVEIYMINFKKIGSDRALWGIYYNKGQNNFSGLGTGTSYFSVLSGNSKLHYQKDDQRITADKEKTFTCPNYAFIDYSGINEVCISDSTSCGAKFEKGPFKLSDKSIFNDIENYISTDAMNYLDYKTTGLDSLNAAIISKTKDHFNKEYSFGTTYEMPEFIKNYIEHFDDYGITFKNSPQYKKYIESMNKVIDEKVANGEITKEEADKLKDEVKSKIDDKIGANSHVKGPAIVLREYDETCKSVLGDQMTKIINNIFRLIQYLGPVLVAIFTTKDFLNASLKGDQAEVKKASSKFSKRVVAAILLFFVPLICDLMFGLVGVTIPKNCIGK